MTEVPYTLFRNYLKGLCTQKERGQVEAWMEAHPGCFEEEMMQEFLAGESAALPMEVEVEMAELIASVNVPEAPLPQRIGTSTRWWMAAAALLLLTAGITIKSVSRRHPGKGQYAGDPARQWVAPAGGQQRIVLPDNSVVTLFPGTRLRIPDDFNVAHRKVQLQGRAYFEVAKDPAKPFEVGTPELKTRVLGTSFEINATDSMQVDVSVCTGLVGINKGEKELARLAPDQQIHFSRITGLFTVRRTDATRLCRWTTGELAFENTPLPEICHTLQQWYGIPLSMDEKKWQNKKVSVTFEGQPVATVLKILSMTAGFQYTMTPEHIIIN